MAIRKFIKMYNIRREDVDDKGNVNPDAALYPMYMTQYRDNKTGKPFSELPPEAIDDKLSDEDKPYDNSTNAHPKRTVHVHEAGNDDSTHIVGPDLKRGYSALSFANKDKRHGDDYFSDWHKIDRDNDVHSILHTDASKIMDNTRYGMLYSDAGGDVRSIADTISPGSHYSGFHTIPLIIEADDSDVVNYNDVIKDNYDPTRDYLPEVQLKRIIRRSIMPNALTNNSKAMYMESINEYANTIFGVLNAMQYYGPELNNIADSTGYMHALNTKLDTIFENTTRYCGIVIDRFYEMSDMFEDLSSVDSVIDTALVDMGYLLDDIEQATQAVIDVYTKFKQSAKEVSAKDTSLLKETAKLMAPIVKKLCTQIDNLLKPVHNIQYRLPEMSFAGTVGEYVPNMDAMKEATQKGGAFDWYDRSTYSDERLKNIYSGCRDVTLSDKQLKYIYDDFRKFKKGATQNNITKGLRGLGQ
jgi:hypothetical protein